MLNRVTVFIGILGFLLPLCALADEVVVPLTITSPDFPASTETAAFLIDLPIDGVTQISLHLEGSYQEVIYVDVSRPYVTETRPAYLDMYLGGNGGEGWEVSERHQFPAGEGLFDFEVTLLSRDGGDWSFLSSGAGQIGLECGPGYIQGPTGQIAGAGSSWGLVTAASLIVSYDPSVPIDGCTWGSIKTMYR